jgi:hypothetical protein
MQMQVKCVGKRKSTCAPILCSVALEAPPCRMLPHGSTAGDPSHKPRPHPRATLLPPHELTTLLMTITEAVDLARGGDVASDYTSLMAGLERAQDIAADGVEWAAELAERYRQALAPFEERWGVGQS